MELPGARRDQVLPLLEAEPVLDAAAVRRVSEATGVPEAEIWGTARFYSLLAESRTATRVCQSVSCKLAGSDALHQRLEEQGVEVIGASCLGQCDRAPVALGPDHELIAQRPRGGITPADPDLPIDLGSPDDTSYAALARARELGPDGVLEQIVASGLQGRGGAGFPAHIKWSSVKAEANPVHYLVINADEGEPGTFKDREIMLRRPHRMVEGAAIAALTIGATDVYVYIRGEFSEERRSVERALAEAGDLLDGIDFHLVAGHGAYICGEETALLESIEGRRGMPRLKPPFPTQMGLWSKPTLVHNVETLACVPAIVLRGGDWFRSLGRTEPGTKLYCLSGHVRHPGVYELPLGVDLDELVAHAGGYLGEPRAFSPGGASSGFLSMDQRSLPLDFKGLSQAGSMLGSAGVVVLDNTVDMAVATRWQLIFFEDESCGQCAPCRIGTQVLRRSLDRYLETGSPGALCHLDDLAFELEEGSICGLGMVAPLPLTSALKHFPEDFAPRSSHRPALPAPERP